MTIMIIIIMIIIIITVIVIMIIIITIIIIITVTTVRMRPWSSASALRSTSRCSACGGAMDGQVMDGWMDLSLSFLRGGREWAVQGWVHSSGQGETVLWWCGIEPGLIWCATRVSALLWGAGYWIHCTMKGECYLVASTSKHPGGCKNIMTMLFATLGNNSWNISMVVFAPPAFHTCAGHTGRHARFGPKKTKMKCVFIFKVLCMSIIKLFKIKTEIKKGQSSMQIPPWSMFVFCFRAMN